MLDHYKCSKIPTASRRAMGSARSVPVPRAGPALSLPNTSVRRGWLLHTRLPSRARLHTPWLCPLLYDFVLRRAEGKTFLLFHSHEVSRFWMNRCNKGNSYMHLLARLELRVLKARLFCAKAVDIWKSLNIKIYSSVKTENNTYLTHDISLAFIQLESISS